MYTIQGILIVFHDGSHTCIFCQSIWNTSFSRSQVKYNVSFHFNYEAAKMSPPHLVEGASFARQFRRRRNRCNVSPGACGPSYSQLTFIAAHYNSFGLLFRKPQLSKMQGRMVGSWAARLFLPAAVYSLIIWLCTHKRLLVCVNRLQGSMWPAKLPAITQTQESTSSSSVVQYQCI